MASTNYKILIDELKHLLPDNRLVKYLDINFSLRVKQNANELINSVLQSLIPKDASGTSTKQTASMKEIIYTPDDVEFKESSLTENINWENVFQPVIIGKDYRVKKITLENFRKFPAIPKGDNEGYPYGISFMNSASEPCSAVILGSNGVGKSSVYESIEYLYRKDIGEARLRDYGRREDREDFAHTRYLTNWNHPQEAIKAEMEVVDGNKIDPHTLFKLRHEALTGCLENCFFISEYEVMHYGKMKFEHGGRNSLRMQLAKALDFEEFAWLDRLLFKLSIYENPKKVADTEYINSRINEYKSVIEENNKYFSQVELLVELDMAPAKRIEFLEKFLERFDWINRIGIITYIQNIITSLTLILQEQSYKKTASKISLSAFIKIVRNGKIVLDNLSQLQVVYEKIEEEGKEIREISAFNSLRLSNGDLLNNLTQIIKNSFVETFSNIKNDKVQEMAVSSLLYLQDIAADFIKQIRTMLPLIENSLDERRRQFEWLSSLDEIKNFYKNYNLPQLQNKIKENERLLAAINTLKNEDLIQYNHYKIIHCIRREAYQIYQLVHTEISSRFQRAVEDVNEKVIQKVMKEFLDEQEISLVWIWDKWDISLDEEGMPKKASAQPQYLSCKIKNNRLNEEISVKKYFNTFRYHLFNTILNIALSFAIMKKLEVRLPVVLDDMFYASDFTNRNRISKFVKTILTSYESIFNDDKDIKDKPLQLIIFTHDEMIFKGIWEMIGNLNNKNQKESTEDLKCKYDFLFYTLLPHQEAEENRALQINDLTFNFNQ
ncbi:AAA family ATPase [Parabacteroides pacaensis]|uniref:hypothetical protein n=1 Tax=Parabacteroides pacaensis TaxID=2086575 RepID=UPI000D101564|nr:hypothetical protein [Parabacteroides pacaensis]